MQRYNIFHQVHKGLRASLYETALQVQHTDFWNVEEGETLITRIKELTGLFEKHADSEDTYVFPAIEKFEPAVTDAFAQEHVKDHLLGQLLSESLELYRNAAIINDKAEAGKMIQSCFTRFLVFNIEHMAREEDILNELLWRYYTDQELQQITQQILAGIAPEYMRQFSKWMLRGLNTAEITGWLRVVEKTAPEPVFQNLFFTAEKELPQRRFRQVIEGLSDGTMVA